MKSIRQPIVGVAQFLIKEAGADLGALQAAHFVIFSAAARAGIVASDFHDASLGFFALKFSNRWQFFYMP
jgi:hypothetical protein